MKTQHLLMKMNNEIITPLNILYAEDDLEDRNIFEKVLSEIQIPVNHKIVKNGELLMNYLYAADPLPDLIFLDLSMPLKTGFECLAEIKDNKKLKNVKVVMLTASFTRGTELEDILKSTLKGMGALDYIRKTHDMVQFKAVIEGTLYSISQEAS